MIVNSLFVMEFFHKWTYFYVGKLVDSTTFELTKYKFAKLVLDSNDIWLVQVNLIWINFATWNCHEVKFSILWISRKHDSFTSPNSKKQHISNDLVKLASLSIYWPIYKDAKNSVS